nr:AN1-type zinc finger protein 2B isoform X4 [Kogia breviceps]
MKRLVGECRVRSGRRTNSERPQTTPALQDVICPCLRRPFRPSWRNARAQRKPSSSQPNTTGGAGLDSSGTFPHPSGTARDVPALRDDVSAPARARGGVGAAGREALTLRRPRPVRRWSFRTLGLTVRSRAVSAWIFCRSSATPARASFAQTTWHTPSITVDLLTKRGEPPDRAVGEHIDGDCRSDPAQQKRKIFTNKCERSGCRQREMMKLTCDHCGRNFCIKHRHPLDHDCSGEGHPTSRAGLAAISRAQSLASSTKTIPSPNQTSPSSTSASRATTQSPSRTASPVIALQNGLSEDEALQRALELSLAETKPQVPRLRAAA